MVLVIVFNFNNWTINFVEKTITYTTYSMYKESLNKMMVQLNDLGVCDFSFTGDKKTGATLTCKFN